MSVGSLMVRASGAVLSGKGEERQPGSREPDAFHICTQLILSHFLRNRMQISFYLTPLAGDEVCGTCSLLSLERKTEAQRGAGIHPQSHGIRSYNTPGVLP